MNPVKCKIVLESYQMLGNERDETKEVYEGTYMDRGEKKYLSYKRVDDGDECNVLIAFDGNGMTLSQSGALNSKLTFVEGQKTLNDYGTPAGIMQLELYTKQYKVMMLRNTIDLKLNYELVLGRDAIRTNMHLFVEML